MHVVTKEYKSQEVSDYQSEAVLQFVKYL